LRVRKIDRNLCACFFCIPEETRTESLANSLHFLAGENAPRGKLTFHSTPYIGRNITDLGFFLKKVVGAQRDPAQRRGTSKFPQGRQNNSPGLVSSVLLQRGVTS